MVPVYLEVICAVYLDGLLILEAIWLGRKRKKIWLFFRLEPFTPAVCPAFHDLIVVLIIQLHQSGIELSYRGEGLMVCTAVVVTIHLIYKAFNRSFVSGLAGTA